MRGVRLLAFMIQNKCSEVNLRSLCADVCPVYGCVWKTEFGENLSEGIKIRRHADDADVTDGRTRGREGARHCAMAAKQPIPYPLEISCLESR